MNEISEIVPSDAAEPLPKTSVADMSVRPEEKPVASDKSTVYRFEDVVTGQFDAADALVPLISKGWSLATALSLLAWFVFAPQCLSTIAAVKRETGGWRIPVIMLSYLFGLAYLAAFITFRVASYFGLA